MGASMISWRAPPAGAHETELESFFDRLPVHDVPPRLDVVRPAVLIVQIIGVLPDVEPEQNGLRRLAVHQRIVLVRRAGDREFAALVEQPRPAGTEAPDARRGELFLELLEITERRLDRVAQLAARRAPGTRTHQLP